LLIPNSLWSLSLFSLFNRSRSRSRFCIFAYLKLWLLIHLI